MSSEVMPLDEQTRKLGSAGYGRLRHAIMRHVFVYDRSEMD
jgi:hypothetical protein